MRTRFPAARHPRAVPRFCCWLAKCRFREFPFPARPANKCRGVSQTTQLLFVSVVVMKGRVVEKLAHRLDRAAAAVGRENPERKPAHLLTGKRGEEAAYFYLRRRGYLMIARNWRSPRHHGELDLVGWDADVLCFIEVKTRTTRDIAPGETAVDWEKRRELGAVARDFRRRVPGSPQVRFDIVSVYYGTEVTTPEITLFKNAFPMP